MSITFILSYMIRIFETGIHIKDDGEIEYINVFQTLGDAYWYMWVTYATGKLSLYPSRLWRIHTKDKSRQDYKPHSGNDRNNDNIFAYRKSSV
jgi:hypothetical protein